MAIVTRKRTLQRTLVVFAPFVFLVLSAWVYAVYLDRAANRTMYAQGKDRSSPVRQSAQQAYQQRLVQAQTDDMVIGDSKDNIFYFIQVSDLHISTFRKASTANFYTFLSTALPLIGPSFVVVTGDLTDAKDKKLVGSMQYMDEWITYQEALKASGVLTKRNGSGTFWHDLRGNHDCFNVPEWDSDENMFAEMSATRSAGFMFEVKTDYGKYGFIGIDSCPKPGPARPYNFFGLFERPDMDYLAERLLLSQNNNHSFIFSHYPVTTTVFGQTSKGETFADLSESFSVYMCGHLHKLKWGLGDALQSYQPTHFLELEVGDMKQHGIYRVMVVDHDLISYSDISMPLTTIPPALLPPQKQNDGHFNASLLMERKLPSNPVAVITNPKDSRYLIPHHEPVGRIAKSTHIRFLVWADLVKEPRPAGENLTEAEERTGLEIEIRIDGQLHPNPARFVGTKQEDQTEDHEFLPLYVSEWNPDLYQDGKEHELAIKVIDINGRVGIYKSTFRADGLRSDLRGGFAEWVMNANIAAMIKSLFAAGYLAVTLFLLILPKLYSLHLQTSPAPPSPLAESTITGSSEAAALLAVRERTSGEEVGLDTMSDNDTPPGATGARDLDEGSSRASSPAQKAKYRNAYDAWLDRKSRHLHHLSSTLISHSSHHRLYNRIVNHTVHAHILRFVHFSTQPVLFYTTLIYTLALISMPHFYGNFVPAAGDQGVGYFYLQGIFLPYSGGHVGGGLGPATGGSGPLSLLQQLLPKIVHPDSTTGQHFEALAKHAGGTWIPMADTWMSMVWTVIYDLVLFLYYLTWCATPAGYLYSPSNPHRLRPYHRTWYVRCTIFGIWVYRCCAVLITAELYGPSVIWTGIGTWWLVVVGWLMFVVGWSKSRVERDVMLLREN